MSTQQDCDSIQFKTIENVWQENMQAVGELGKKIVGMLGTDYIVEGAPGTLTYNNGSYIRIRKNIEKILCVSVCVKFHDGQPSVIFHNPNEHGGSIVFNYDRFDIGANPLIRKDLNEMVRRIKGFIETGNKY